MSQAGEIDILGTHPEIPTEFITNAGTAVPIANQLEILGTSVAAGSIPVRTTGSGNTVTVQVQTSQEIGATDATKIGLAAFDSAGFDVDANGFVTLAGGGGATTNIDVDAHTAPGTDPVVPNAGNIIMTGAQVATGVVGTNVIRTNSLAANTVTIQIQRSTAVAATDITKNGVSHFNSGQFTVDANGFVSLAGGGEAIDSIGVQTGTNPIAPTVAGLVTINGAVVAAGTNPVRTDGTGANTMAVEVQISQAIAATDATKIGLCNFDSAAFDVDANGFVQLNGGGIAVLSVSGTANRITSTGGANPIIDISASYVGQSSITTLGTITTGVWTGTTITATSGGTGLNTYATGDILYASAANTLSKLPASTNGFVLTLAAGIPSWVAPSGGTVTSVSGTANRITSTGGTTPVIDISAAYVGQTSITTLGTITTGTWNGSVIPLAFGGTNANLTASTGGIFYSTSTAGAILAGTATAGQMLRSGATAAPTWSTATFPSTATSAGTILRADGTNWAASTATYPNTTTSQQILYSTAANTIGELTTANSKFPATNSSGTLAMRAFSVVVQTFTGNGTYTPTAGMLYCTIECLGGGAGGGGIAGSAATTTSAGGGGAGSYARKTVTAATIGASQTVTVGAAANGGTAGNNNGTAGNDTSVGTICIGKGGGAGTGSAAGGVGAGGLGGVAGTGDFTPTGQPGFTAIGSGAATSYFGLGGAGGSSQWGGGGRAPVAAIGSTGGNNATNYGSGGSGAAGHAANANAAGGNGSAGLVVITEYVIA